MKEKEAAIVEEINLYSFIFDSEKEIKGQVILITEEVIHVEYKRFKGDEDPFVIEYFKNNNPLKEIKKTEKGHPQLLTVGKLKKALNNCCLDDNAVVLAEHEDNDKNGEWFQLDPQFKTLYKNAFSASSSKNGKFLIHINY